MTAWRPGGIGPASRLRVVDAILSGTHEPGSSHYQLLRAFLDEGTLAGASAALEAAGYRTHEFGDSVLVEKQDRAADVARWDSWPDRSQLVGDVRGSGLLTAVELVRDRDTLAPATTEASDVVNRLRDEGILIGTDGPHHNVLEIRPPMPFTTEDADVLAATLATFV